MITAIRKFTTSAIVFALLTILLSASAFAQATQEPTATRVQASYGLYPLTALTATAAVNNQVTLTIPAPPAGLYAYVCSLAFWVSQDGTATAHTNAVTTNTNFGTFALKYSLAATANLTLQVANFQWGSPSTGCPKSALPGTATTFVSPAAAANSAYTLATTYFYAP